MVLVLGRSVWNTASREDAGTDLTRMYRVLEQSRSYEDGRSVCVPEGGTSGLVAGWERTRCRKWNAITGWRGLLELLRVILFTRRGHRGRESTRMRLLTRGCDVVLDRKSRKSRRLWRFPLIAK